MILADSPPEVVFKTLEDEKPKILYALEKYERRAYKDFLQTKRFPFVWCDTYTVPSSHNTYLIWYYADNKKTAAVRTYNGTALMLDDSKGNKLFYLRRTFSEVDDDARRIPETKYVLHMYTGHFFSRYRDRFDVKSVYKGNEIPALFFGRNVLCEAKLYEDMVVKRADKYKDCAVYQVRDGITFGSETTFNVGSREVLSIVFKTFVSFDMLKEQQKDHVMNSDLLNAYADMIRDVNDPRYQEKRE